MGQERLQADEQGGALRGHDVDGYLDCFHVLAILNSAAKNITEKKKRISQSMHPSKLWFSPDRWLGMGLLGHMVTLILVFSGTSILFSIVAVPIYISTNSAGGFLFLHTLSSMYFL